MAKKYKSQSWHQAYAYAHLHIKSNYEYIQYMVLVRKYNHTKHLKETEYNQLRAMLLINPDYTPYKLRESHVSS